MKPDNESIEYEALRTPFDHPIEVFGRIMNVNIQGSGDQTVVILPGRGVTAPSYDFAALIARVKDKFKVITVEYFGSGLSGMTDQPRNSEQIVREVHEALSKLGVGKFTLVAHSIAGIYGLHYANLYPHEIEAFVGIDTATPGMDRFITPELLEKTSSPERPEDQPYDVREDIADVIGYTYSEKDLKIMQALYQRNRHNDAIFEASRVEDKSSQRTEKSYDLMRFPEYIPTLFFLSSESVGYAPSWYVREHEKQCTAVEGSRVTVLEGGHFLHHSQAEVIAQGIKKL